MLMQFFAALSWGDIYGFYTLFLKQLLLFLLIILPLLRIPEPDHVQL